MPPSIDRILLSTFSSPILPPAVDVLAIMSRLIAHPSYLSHDNLSTLSIAELAEQAQKERGPTDPSLSIKHWLRFADQARQAGRRCVEDGHYERAFIEYAKSAMAVVEVIPAHKDYRRLLTDSQGHNLGLDILDALSEVKQIIVMARDQERGGHIVPSPIIPTSTRGEDSSREAFDGAELPLSRPCPVYNRTIHKATLSLSDGYPNIVHVNRRARTLTRSANGLALLHRHASSHTGRRAISLLVPCALRTSKAQHPHTQRCLQSSGNRKTGQHSREDSTTIQTRAWVTSITSTRQGVFLHVISRCLG
ncbi:hypothetical protein BV25DRAFT_1528912 [Artomyces pyxidatus]|uniref:Uncharacterized protein n=1 Tax=Artomyces pyxidatus TaxID=48021 RepID=A0ACB8TCU4_9AGAM|nr:hypothetical protein BV25DRAFT_1528912 [Artomyces pyxidatus]